MSEYKQHPVGEVLGLTMEKIKQMVDTDVIIGKPIHVDDVTIIPVSRISVGFASGGTDFSKKQSGSGDSNFGGGGGAGVNVSPVVFLVVQGGVVRILGVDSAPVTTVDRVLDMMPGVLDKVEGFIDRQNAKNQAKAIETQEE